MIFKVVLQSKGPGNAIEYLLEAVILDYKP